MHNYIQLCTIKLCTYYAQIIYDKEDKNIKYVAIAACYCDEVRLSELVILLSKLDSAIRNVYHHQYKFMVTVQTSEQKILIINIIKFVIKET